MNSKQITSRQMQAVIIMFIMASSFVMGETSKSKQDTWVTFILGGLMEVPLIFVYCAVICKYPNDNLFEISIKLFGKIIGKIVCALYVWYALHICSMVLKTFTIFIHTLNMPETPEIAILCFMILLSIWAVKSGPENMARIAKTTFPVVTAFVIITVAVSFKDMDFSVLKPVLSTDIQTLLSTSYTAFSLPFAEIVVFMTLFPFLKSKSNPKKVYLKSLTIAVLIFVLINLRNILVLGVPSTKMFYFPSYQSVSVISFGEFFTRIEVLIGVNILLAGFTKISVLLFAASAGLSKIFNVKDYKMLVTPCALIIVVLTIIDYRNSYDLILWIKYHQIYVIPFQIILPIVIWITAEIKSRIKKSDPPPEPGETGSLE